MKVFYAFALIIITLCTNAQSMEMPDFKTSYLPMWQRAAEYLLNVAEAMPDSLYQYKPTADVYTFEAQMLHLADNMFWLSTTKIEGEDYTRQPPGENVLGKEEVLKKLHKAFEKVEATVQDFNEEELHSTLAFGGTEVTKERIFYLIRDHITHHRAQAILYLRMNGITPPKYVGW